MSFWNMLHSHGDWQELFLATIRNQVHRKYEKSTKTHLHSVKLTIFLAYDLKNSPELS